MPIPLLGFAPRRRGLIDSRCWLCTGTGFATSTAQEAEAHAGAIRPCQGLLDSGNRRL